MIANRQFSLGYLFVETLWIALALAATRGAVLEWTAEAARASLFAVLFASAGLFWSIAIGGLIGRMEGGAGVGVVLFWLLAWAYAGQ